MMQTMNQRATKYDWGAALACGAVLRVILFHVRPQLSNDGLMYGELAHNMVANHVFGFTDTILRPTLIRLPGYPLFLAACFALFGRANYVAVIWAQIVVDLASSALLGGLASRLWGRKAGLFALWLSALCPFTANYSVAVLTETLSILCIVLALFSLERWDALRRTSGDSLRWVAVCSCAMSFAVLLRPDQGLLAAVIIPVLLWVGLTHRHRTIARSLRPTALASVVFLLPLILWSGRNWRTFHVIQPLAPRYANDPGEDVPYGFQRWFRTWAVEYKSTVDVYWNYDDAQLNLADLPPRAFDNAEQLAQTRALYTQYNQVTSATPAFDQAFARIASERIGDHPWRYYLLLPVARELNMWLRPRTELLDLPVAWWAVRAHPKRSIAEIAYALLNAGYLVLAIAGLIRWRRHGWTGRGPLAFAMISFVGLRCLLLLTLDNSEPRYTLEAFPIVVLMASFSLLPRAETFSD